MTRPITFALILAICLALADPCVGQTGGSRPPLASLEEAARRAEARRAEKRAQALAQKGRLAEAAAYEVALARTEEAYGKSHRATAQVANDLGYVYRSLGQLDKAESLYRRALKIREAKLGKDHPAVADSLNNLALLHVDRGEYAKAEPLYRKSLTLREKKLGAGHRDRLEALAKQEQGRPSSSPARAASPSPAPGGSASTTCAGPCPPMACSSTSPAWKSSTFGRPRARAGARPAAPPPPA